MSHVELEDRLWQLARGARWFSGRGRDARLAGVELGPWLPTTPAIRSAILHVAYPDDQTERYHIPLAQVDGELVEACDDPTASGQLLDALAAQHPGFERYAEVPTGLTGRRYRGEQSNTNVFFGNAAMLKVLRSLPPSPTPELELSAALSGTDLAPKLLGAWRWGNDVLGVFFEQLADPQDGFELACRQGKAGEPFTEPARDLGATVRRLHEVFATKFPTAETDAATQVEALTARLHESAQRHPQLRDFVGPIEAFYTDLDHTPIPLQRIHGDLHLGQTLLTPLGWRIVDFEGEPLVASHLRSRPDSRWRDVAGMLRSFDYAAATSGAPNGWLAEARSAFLEGYDQHSGQGAHWLLAYELDKAVYEVGYELRNRPGWESIPLTSLTTALKGI